MNPNGTITDIKKGRRNGHRFQAVQFAHGAKTIACWGDDWGMQADGPDRWSVACETHGHVMEFATYSEARDQALIPGYWCSCCAEEIKTQAETVEVLSDTCHINGRTWVLLGNDALIRFDDDEDRPSFAKASQWMKANGGIRLRRCEERRDYVATVSRQEADALIEAAHAEAGDDDWRIGAKFTAETVEEPAQAETVEAAEEPAQVDAAETFELTWVVGEFNDRTRLLIDGEWLITFRDADPVFGDIPHCAKAARWLKNQGYTYNRQRPGRILLSRDDADRLRVAAYGAPKTMRPPNPREKRDALERERDAAIEERDALKAELVALKNERADRDLDAYLEARRKAEAAVERERASLEQERDALQADLQKVAAQRNRLEDKRDALTKERDALQAERDALNETIRQLHLNTIPREVAAAERDELKAERDALQAERDALEEKQGRADALFMLNSHLLKRRDDLERERDDLKAERDALEEQLEETGHERDYLDTERDALENTLLETAHDRDCLEARLSEMTEARDALERELRDADKAREEMRTQMNLLVAQSKQQRPA